MLLDYPFATIVDMKRRLGYASPAGTHEHDALMTEILKAVSATIEGAAARPLRRHHARTEYHTGGTDRIRLRVAPVAVIHTIRESASRDFETSGSYTELVETDDYIFQPGDEEKGESGVLIRLNGNWMGNGGNPGQVRVVYTGGYRTTGEDELADTAITIDGDNLDDFGLRVNNIADYTTPFDSETAESYQVLDPAGTTVRVQDDRSNLDLYFGMFAFNLADFFPATWEAVSAELSLYSLAPPTGETIELIFPREWFFGNPKYASAENVLIGLVDHPLLVFEPDGSYKALDLFNADASSYWTDAEQKAFVQQGIVDGYLGILAFPGSSGVDPFTEHTIYAKEHADADKRPKLIMLCRPTLYDPFTVPGDLRHASLIQGIYEFQHRAQPGIIAASQRGVQIASGASITKNEVHLLPEVLAVAEKYRRLY